MLRQLVLTHVRAQAQSALAVAKYIVTQGYHAVLQVLLVMVTAMQAIPMLVAATTPTIAAVAH